MSESTEDSGKKRGRPPPLQPTDTVEVTLPDIAIGYLRFLAKNSLLGATPNAVASLILTNELMRMAQAEIHRIAIPRA